MGGKILILGLMVSLVVNLTDVNAARFNTNEGMGSVSSSTAATVLLNPPVEWRRYLDPQNDDFWTEGNHKPDAGFLIFAKNPTLQNAKYWLIRNELKAKRLQQMFPLVEQAQRELVKSGVMEDRYNMVKEKGIISKIKSFFTKNSDKKELKSSAQLMALEYYFLFSPNCPYCKQMADTLRAIPNVIPLQIDSGPLYNWSGLAASNYATKETIKSYLSDGRVPLLIIYNRKNNQAQILRGVQNTETIILASANILKGGR